MSGAAWSGMEPNHGVTYVKVEDDRCFAPNSLARIYMHAGSVRYGVKTNR